ncbi:MAG TPA: hemerythrin domain-containing protein [Eoetvoesiella sp.]
MTNSTVSPLADPEGLFDLMTMNTEPLLPPETERDVTLLGYGPMDKIHQEFDTLVQYTLTCPDAELAKQIKLLKQHLQEHFQAEDSWMRETSFPAADCHINEHAAVLQSANEVSDQVATGDVSSVRSFAAALADWFPGHADYLDSALAHWMCKLRFGGKPVVLHRNPPVERASLANN